MQKEITNLRPCDKQQGYFIVPGLERFSVSREGYVFDRVDNEIASSSLNTEVVNTKTYLSVYDNPVHRMVAETFLCKDHLPSDVVLVVNHLDGNIRNNNYKNLEWTTYSGNSVHAYETGLRPDNIPLLCKNSDTGEIIRFYSYWDCARYFKTNGANVYIYLNRKKLNRLFLDNYILIKEGDPWPDIDIELCRSQVNNNILIYDKESLKAFVFTGPSDAARYLKVSAALMTKLTKQCRSSGTFSTDWKQWSIVPFNRAEDWMLSIAEDMRVTRKVTKHASLIRKPKEVTVESMETGETKNYKSLEEYCNLIGEKKNTVQKHILINNGVWRGKYKICYL